MRGGGGDAQRVTIGRGAGCKLGAGNTAAASLVLDDKLLAEQIGQFLRNDPRDDIVGAAGRKCRHNAHRLRGVVLRLCRRYG